MMDSTDFLNFYIEIILNVAKKRNVKLYLHERREVIKEYVLQTEEIISEETYHSYYIAEYEKREISVLEKLVSNEKKWRFSDDDIYVRKNKSYHLIKELNTINDLLEIKNINELMINFVVFKDWHSTAIDYDNEVMKLATNEQFTYFVTQVLDSESTNSFIGNILLNGHLSKKYNKDDILFKEERFELVKKYLEEIKFKNKLMINNEEDEEENEEGEKVLRNRDDEMYTIFYKDFYIQENLEKYFSNSADDLLTIYELINNEKLMLSTLKQVMYVSGYNFSEYEKVSDHIIKLLMKTETGISILKIFINEVISSKNNGSQTYIRDLLQKNCGDKLELFADFELLQNKKEIAYTPTKLKHIGINISLDQLQKNYPIKYAHTYFYKEALDILSKAFSISTIEMGNVFVNEMPENQILLSLYVSPQISVSFNQIEQLLNNYFSYYIEPMFSKNNENISRKEWSRQKIEEVINMTDLVNWLNKCWSAQQLEEQLPTNESTQGNKI